MKTVLSTLMLVAGLAFFAAPASADDYADTVKIFKNAGESSGFFKNSYGYAVFPTVGKAGLGVGAAHGSGRVYVQGKHVGDVKLNQLSVGAQAGGQAFSQIVFFQDKRAFDDFASGNFEFDATVQAVAITASATASTATSGNNASAAGGKNDASTAGQYKKGLAVFTVAKGGLMYQAAVGGQKFKYKALGAK
ncbi:MAG TPA: lipid-binding SYLF domain-containing protein [Steroidobacteraceae bacterium]|jgi:lipid-binding SYLF domain-containing protein|nr:lipid-binding SYLF domain-containing protein [Steroidobacteraceae bacterium]